MYVLVSKSFPFSLSVSFLIKILEICGWEKWLHRDWETDVVYIPKYGWRAIFNNLKQNRPYGSTVQGIADGPISLKGHNHEHSVRGVICAVKAFTTHS